MNKTLWSLSKYHEGVVNKIKSLPVAIVLTLNNFKGGVGK